MPRWMEGSIVTNGLAWWGRARQPGPPQPQHDSVRQAYAELQAMDRYFQEVTDPTLIDHAAYLLKAAEEKYRHCLRQARNLGA